VSSLVQLPDFVSGLGTLYVDPTTLPQGLFLAYDQQGNLVSSVYIIVVKDLRVGKASDSIAIRHPKANHIGIYYNNGHPGAPSPTPARCRGISLASRPRRCSKHGGGLLTGCARRAPDMLDVPLRKELGGPACSCVYPSRVRSSRAFNKYKNIVDMMDEPKGVREHKENNDEDHCEKLQLVSS
jgi:hypothetical protein